VIPRITSAVLITLLLGCADGGDSASPAISDSLGVSVIEYDNDFGAASGPQGSTDTMPLFSVGQSSPELYRVRTARFLSDGQFVVANGGSRELLLFDQTGQLVARVGGEGQGPGEFRELTYLSVGPGDSLFAYDVRQRRFSVFDRRGQFARSMSLRGADSVGSLRQAGVLGSGEVVGAIHSRTPGPGLVRDSLILMTFNPSGELERRLGVFPHQYTHWGPHPNPEGAGTIEAPIVVAFSSMADVAMGDTSVFVGLPENYALIRLSLDGDRRVTRQRQPPATLTETHRDRLFAKLASDSIVIPEELEILRELRGPTTLPGFGFEPLTVLVGEQPLLVTDLDEVWLLAFQLPDDSASEKWFRLDAEGRYQGTVAMPACFRATDVREDVVLGICRDSSGVEYVHAYRLIVSTP
jgi:hypothetical protein